MTCHCEDLSHQKLPEKSWHSPYQTDKVNARIFQVVDWPVVVQLKSGMLVNQLKSLGILTLEPYGNADALLFSFDPGKTEYEVELKFSNEKISDISFRPITQSHHKEGLDTPISMQITPPTEQSAESNHH